MEFQNKKDEEGINKLLCKWVPVIEQRSKLTIRIRLWVNYLLEALIFTGTAVKMYTGFFVNVPYFQLCCLLLRVLLILLSFKFSLLTLMIVNKLIVIASVFSAMDSSLSPLAISTFILQIVASWLLAFSGEQRRGSFDERLNLWIPFLKEVVAMLCPFLLTGFSYASETVQYILILLSALHLIFGVLDEIYNFDTKKKLCAVSLFNLLAVCSLVLLVVFPTISPTSLGILAVSIYAVAVVWIANLGEFSNFKILEHNPNNFVEWEYSDYFNKLIYLIQNHTHKENDQLLRGFYNFHLTICSSPECPIRYSHELDKMKKESGNLEESFEENFEEKIEFIEKYLRNQMEIATIKFPSLSTFYIFYISPSIEALRYCDKKSFCQYREWTRIEKALQDKHIEFKTEKCRLVREEIKQKLEGYLDMSNSFWRLLYDDNINLSRLEELGAKMLDLQVEIKQYDNNHFLDSKALRILQEFKHVILDEKITKSNSNDESAKFGAFLDIHTRQEPILIISAEPETFQKIQNVNATCCKFLGYSKDQLLEKNLSNVIPEFVQAFHQKLLLQRSREILYAQQKNLKTLVYVVTSSGYLQESKLTILQLNSISGRRWSCTFQPTHQLNCIMLLDDKNIIQGITPNGIQLRLSVNCIGKEFNNQLIESLEAKKGEFMLVENRLDNLLDEDDDNEDGLKETLKEIRLKDVVDLEMTKMKVIEMEIRPPNVNMNQINIYADPVEMEKEFMYYNFPNQYSNINENRQVKIEIPEQQHYEFVNFGEGINEMRYLNGMVQFKEDKSESSFQKQNTENSLVEIVDFVMKKQTYLEALELSKKNLPRPIFELNVLIIGVVLSLLGIAIANYIIFWNSTNQHSAQIGVLSSLQLWFYNFMEIASQAMQIGFINQKIWSNVSAMVFNNMTRQLNAIAQMSKVLTQNESMLNSYIVGYKIDSSTSLYDLIAQFKLQTNTLLNNKNVNYTLASDGPISSILNVTLNYMSPGFKYLSDQLVTLYSSAADSSSQIYIILLCSFVGICIPVLLRVFFINRKLNEEKSKLLSIFLEVEESTTKKIIERNNAFKLMVKYDKDINTDEEEKNDILEEDTEEEEKSARKRIKNIQTIHYFFPFLAFFLVAAAIYSINLYYELNYHQILKSNFNQLVVFDEAHSSPYTAWLTLTYLGIYPGKPVRGKTNYTAIIPQCVAQVYNKQMDLRELYLLNLNAKKFSTDFTSFFIDFWVTNGCKYLTYANCPTDYNAVFKQGIDQVWSQLIRKMDVGATLLIASLPSPTWNRAFFNNSYFLIALNIFTFYTQDVIMIFNKYFVDETIRLIAKTLNTKTILLVAFVVFVMMLLVLYLAIFVRIMRRQTERIEKIVGFIPFKDLVTITEFKKYIRNKYQTEIY